ncbi:Mis6-domain-containing protein [Pseudomassariella vexata]|uniref:Mis6-domain-containing protein n=1 Tax=Pseudomassariella vexata TaxID=1141098 RepID=A0A1Y2EHT1_9PEZI|nr:Mis6-domain-containing protein [Pseudomassariella vexata]ORY71132.1 Mis6-domain-containing protein [Pseudomassariella vexata]
MSEDNLEVMPRGAKDFTDTLSDVIQGAKLPAKRRGTSIKPTVEDLTSQLYERGILPDALEDLIDLITTPSHLDQASLNSIIRNLYPTASVRSHNAIKIIGCLGHGAQKPSLAIQAALLRWLVMVYHIIDKQNALSNAYSVLFNLLDTAAIRPQLCHILALITRRRHVRPFRIQALLSLNRDTGNDPALVGLLRVFKDYYPEIIVGEATHGKASAFKHPDPQWRERLHEIQRAHTRPLDELAKPRDAFRVSRHYGNSNGRGKGAIIPQVHTSHAQENSITLEEIENVDGLVNGLETIQLPNQLISVLADPLLQKLMLLKPATEAHQRVSNWLVSFTQDVMDREADDILGGILELLQSYVSTTKNLPPVVLSFLWQYMKVWDGRESRAMILDILANAPLPSSGFADLYDSIFRPMEAKIIDGSATSQLEILAFYTALLRHWAVVLLSQEQNTVEAAKAVPELIAHVNKLCLAVLQTSTSTSTQSQVLAFYEECARLASNPKLSRLVSIVIPPSPLVYMLYFTLCPATASRLCGILARYKDGFQTATASSRSGYSIAYINEFNGFLMDICNCTWRSRAFNAKDANAHACLMSPNIVESLTLYVKALDQNTPLPSLFTLSAAPTWAFMSASHLRKLEEAEAEQEPQGLVVRHAGPASRSSLATLTNKGGLNMTWDDYRLGVLGYLEDRGMVGVCDLMQNTMTTLMKRA